MRWWSSADKEAALARFHASFPARSRAVMREAERQIEELRATAPPRCPAPRLNDGWEYELERFPFETFVDGVRSAGE
jgi:hypothetical protein